MLRTIGFHFLAATAPAEADIVPMSHPVYRGPIAFVLREVREGVRRRDLMKPVQ